MELELPFPPSVNHLWRRCRNRIVLSRRGREYRRSVRQTISELEIQPLRGPLAVAIDVNPPDRRRRDIDNLHKALLDALGHGGVYLDDSQIDRLSIARYGIVPGGRVRVRVMPFKDWKPEVEVSPHDPSLAKPRSCLKCGKSFDSEGPGNRICPPCQLINEAFSMTEQSMEAQRGAKRRKGEETLDDEEE